MATVPISTLEMRVCVCGDPACDIPFGYCHCGCGKLSPIANRNHTQKRFLVGMPIRFLPTHGSRIRPKLEKAKPFKIDGVYCRLIPLTLGYHAIVWETDYEWLMQWKWWAHRGKRSVYAVRKEVNENGESKNIFMHQLIIGRTSPKIIGDHISGESLDNRRSNLRQSTYKQNSRNASVRHNNSGFKGVSRRSSTRYEAHIRVDGKLLHLGSRSTASEAHVLYCEAAAKYFGEFARTV